jgi:3-oxoacyl-[acyl-carrier-protein] synthase III
VTESWSQAQLAQLIREIVQREVSAGKSVPDDDADLVRTGRLDSMGWIGVLTGIEELTQVPNFGNPWPENRPQSIRALAETAAEAVSASKAESERAAQTASAGRAGGPVAIAGWGFAVGSREFAASAVEQENGLPPGTLQSAAGLESVRIASAQEDQVSLGQSAAEAALGVAGIEAGDVDLLAGTSATLPGLPSFSAALHTRLLLSEQCRVLEAGGACVGLLSALWVANAVLTAEGRGTALVVASEVHSRLLASLQAPGALRGLFGDGACAFVLKGGGTRDNSPFTVGAFTIGCSGRFASAFETRLNPMGGADFHFKGEQLGRAAVDHLQRVVEQLERLSGRPRSQVDAFAVHEPNPRLVRVLAHNLHVPLEKMPLISRTYGNLGSATCGVALCVALRTLRKTTESAHPLIFVATVGPGLLWAGTYVQ